MPDTSPIYISYAWGGDSEKIVNAIDTAVTAAGLVLVRDKRALDYRESIRRFMQVLGRGERVIVVISDRYLRSHNCMFELLEIARDRSFRRRIFPVVLADADIYKAANRVKYIRYWEQEIETLNQSMRSLTSQADLEGVRQEIDLYTRIRAEIAGLIDTLQDMNTLTPQMHEDSHFEQLIEALRRPSTAPESQEDREESPGQNEEPSQPAGTSLKIGSITASGGASVNIAGGSIRQTVVHGAGDDPAGRVFGEIAAVLAGLSLPQADREDLQADLNDLAQAARQPESPDEAYLVRRLRSIRRIAPALLAVFARMPASPPGTSLAVLKQAAEKVKTE